MVGCNFKKILPIIVPKCYSWKNYVFWHRIFKLIRFYFHLQPALYPSITAIVEAMNTVIQERHNHSESCITFKVSWRTQKFEVYLANEGCGLAFFSMDLGHISGSNVGNEVGVMLRGKGSHKPEFAYYIVRIHSLMIYTDLIEYNTVGDTKAPLLRCFFLISELKARDIINTERYINYQTFSILLIISLLEKFFHSIHTDLRDTSVEKIPNVSVGKTRLVLIFTKASKWRFQRKTG